MEKLFEAIEATAASGSENLSGRKRNREVLQSAKSDANNTTPNKRVSPEKQNAAAQNGSGEANDQVPCPTFTRLFDTRLRERLWGRSHLFFSCSAYLQGRVVTSASQGGALTNSSFAPTP